MVCWKVGRPLSGSLIGGREGGNSRGKAATFRRAHKRSQSMDYLEKIGEMNSARCNLPAVDSHNNRFVLLAFSCEFY